MLVTTGIDLSVLFHQKGKCKLGCKSAFKHTKKAWSDPKKRNNAVVVTKTLDHTTPKLRIKSLR